MIKNIIISLILLLLNCKHSYNTKNIFSIENKFKFYSKFNIKNIKSNTLSFFLHKKKSFTKLILSNPKRNYIIIFILFLSTSLIIYSEVSLIFHDTKQTEFNIDLMPYKSICSYENDICPNTKNEICKYLFPYQALYSVHHKTGHKLSFNLFKKIRNWCNIEINDINQTIYSKYYLKKFDSYDFLDKTNELLYLNESTRNVIIFHFIRSPLNTILSGYQFHKKGLENWLKTSLNILGKKKSYHNKQLEINISKNIEYLNKIFVNQEFNITKDFRSLKDYLLKYPYQRSRKCFETKYILNIDWQNKKLYNHSLQYALDNNLKIKKWYNLNDKTGYGIFWEFVRYYNCEYPIIFLMNNIYTKYNYLKWNYIFFNLDSFFTSDGFDKNINILLDHLNIIDNKKNNIILNNHNIYNLNITKFRNNLTQLLKYEDRSSIYKKISTVSDNRFKHITTGRYNKTALKTILFSIHYKICEIIKNLTLSMKFKWLYNKDC